MSWLQIAVISFLSLFGLYLVCQKEFLLWTTDKTKTPPEKKTLLDFEFRNIYTIFGVLLLAAIGWYTYEVYSGVPTVLTENRTHMMERTPGETWVRRFEVGSTKGQVGFDDSFLKHLDSRALQVITVKNPKATDIKFVPESVEYSIVRESSPRMWMRFYKLSTDVRGKVTWKEMEGTPPAKVEKSQDSFLIPFQMYFQGLDLAKQLGKMGLVKDIESTVQVDGVPQLPTGTAAPGTVNNQ